MNNIDSMESEPCKLSEIYKGNDNLVLLHGISKLGALDGKERDITTRLNFINGKRISAFLICIGQSFDYWGNVGVILKDADVIAAFYGDGGIDDENNQVKQMKGADIIRQVDKIVNGNFKSEYSELFITNSVIHGLYYIKNPKLQDFTRKDLNNAHNYFSQKQVYEIEHQSGNVFLVEWGGNDYKRVKEISNRKELFNTQNKI